MKKISLKDATKRRNFIFQQIKFQTVAGDARVFFSLFSASLWLI